MLWGSSGVKVLYTCNIITVHIWYNHKFQINCTFGKIVPDFCKIMSMYLFILQCRTGSYLKPECCKNYPCLHDTVRNTLHYGLHAMSKQLDEFWYTICIIYYAIYFNFILLILVISQMSIFLKKLPAITDKKSICPNVVLKLHNFYFKIVLSVQ